MRIVLNTDRDRSTVLRTSPTALALLAAIAVPCALAAQPHGTLESPPLRATPSSVVPAGDTTVRFAFDIPAQPLRDALLVFGRQAGLRVEARDIAGGDARTRPLAGRYTAPEALRLLLAGTGNRAVFRDAETVVVAAAGEPPESEVQTLGPVVVTAQAARRARYAPARVRSATKTDAPLRDVPQAVTVVTSELIADQGMQSMADVARYLPGVTMGQGEGHRDAPTIRGNASTSDFFVDGVRDDVQYLRDLYNVERVEALKGSNAMIFGRGGGGGVINRVTKDAQWMPTRSLTLAGGSFGHRRATLDAGSGHGVVAGRLNGVLESSRSFRDATGIEREGINPTAAILAGGTLVRLGYEYFADRRTVDRGIPSRDGRPLDTGVGTFFGDPDQSRSRAAVHAADATIERGSSDGVLLRNRSRFARYAKFYRNVFPGAVTDDGSGVVLTAYDNATDRRNVFNQTDLTWSVGTGAVRHTLLGGVEVGRQWTENFRRTGYFAGDATRDTVPVSDPTVSLPVDFRQSATDADNRSDAGVVAAYLQSQLVLGPRWQAVVGLRHDRFALDFDDERTGESLRRTDRMLSPRAGLVFKPAAPLSVYGSYGISHLPASGDQFSSLTVTTRALEPERFVNREVGVKWEPRPDLSLTAAAYRLDRSNTTAPDPADPTRIVQTGRQRTTGIEAGLAGRLTEWWHVAGGWTTQRATIVDRTTSAEPGARVPLVPAWTLSLWNRYRVTRALGAGIGIVRQADMYAAVDNAVTLPAFTRVDAALFLTVLDGVRAQANIENVLDARYFATSHGNNNIMPGAPRTLRLSVTVTP